MMSAKDVTRLRRLRIDNEKQIHTVGHFFGFHKFNSVFYLFIYLFYLFEILYQCYWYVAVTQFTELVAQLSCWIYF